MHALCGDNTGEFMTCSFIVLVLKWRKRKNQPLGLGGTGRYVKLVFSLAFVINFWNNSFLAWIVGFLSYFFSQKNPIVNWGQSCEENERILNYD